jgi:DNA-binding NarL/FixJ family response regulator
MSGAALAAAPREIRIVARAGGRLAISRRETGLVLVGGPRLLRGALCGLIGDQPGMRVIAALPSIEAFEDACRRAATPRCDILLLDADDHKGSCGRAVDRLLALALPCKLVLLSTEASGEIVLCATTRRIDGVLLKESSVSELCDAVAHIANGHAVMPASWRAAPELVELTPRQLDVLKLIAHGQSNDEIAAQLGVRPNTVKFHISDIFRRLGVRNRIEAVAQLEACEAPPR